MGCSYQSGVCFDLGNAIGESCHLILIFAALCQVKKQGTNQSPKPVGWMLITCAVLEHLYRDCQHVHISTKVLTFTDLYMINFI